MSLNDLDSCTSNTSDDNDAESSCLIESICEMAQEIVEGDNPALKHFKCGVYVSRSVDLNDDEETHRAPHELRPFSSPKKPVRYRYVATMTDYQAMVGEGRGTPYLALKSLQDTLVKILEGRIQKAQRRIEAAKAVLPRKE